MGDNWDAGADQMERGDKGVEVPIYCQRHVYAGRGTCPRCDATTCENCQQRPSTENWGGTHDSVSLARNPRLTQRWCRRCVVEAQIAYMRALVPKLAALEQELTNMDAWCGGYEDRTTK